METEIDNKAITERINTLMEKNSVTGYRLCKNLKIPNGSYFNIKKGRQGWSLEYLHKIALYFNVSLDYLVFGDDKETTDSNVIYKLHKFEEEILILKEKEKKYDKFINNLKNNLPET